MCVAWVEGEVFLSSTLPLEGIHTTVTAMLRSIYMSISRLIEASFSSLVIEMDSNMACEFLKKGGRCMKAEGGLVHDIYHVAISL